MSADIIQLWFDAIHQADIEQCRTLLKSNAYVLAPSSNNSLVQKPASPKRQLSHLTTLIRPSSFAAPQYDKDVAQEAIQYLGKETYPCNALQYSLIQLDCDEQKEDLVERRRQVIKLLIEGTPKLDVNQRWGAEENTTLHLAAFLGEKAIVERLVERGADAKIRNRLGFLALDVAYADEETVQYLKSVTGLVAPASTKKVALEGENPLANLSSHSFENQTHSKDSLASTGSQASLGQKIEVAPLRLRKRDSVDLKEAQNTKQDIENVEETKLIFHRDESSENIGVDKVVVESTKPTPTTLLNRQPTTKPVTHHVVKTPTYLAGKMNTTLRGPGGISAARPTTVSSSSAANEDITVSVKNQPHRLRIPAAFLEKEKTEEKVEEVNGVKPVVQENVGLKPEEKKELKQDEKNLEKQVVTEEKQEHIVEEKSVAIINSSTEQNDIVPEKPNDLEISNSESSEILPSTESDESLLKFRTPPPARNHAPMLLSSNERPIVSAPVERIDVEAVTARLEQGLALEKEPVPVHSILPPRPFNASSRPPVAPATRSLQKASSSASLIVGAPLENFRPLMIPPSQQRAVHQKVQESRHTMLAHQAYEQFLQASSAEQLVVPKSGFLHFQLSSLQGLTLPQTKESYQIFVRVRVNQEPAWSTPMRVASTVGATYPIQAEWRSHVLENQLSLDIELCAHLKRTFGKSWLGKKLHKLKSSTSTVQENSQGLASRVSSSSLSSLASNGTKEQAYHNVVLASAHRIAFDRALLSACHRQIQSRTIALVPCASLEAYGFDPTKTQPVRGQIILSTFYLGEREEAERPPTTTGSLLQACQQWSKEQEWMKTVWCEGHLSQRGDGLKFWKRRYFVLWGAYLLAFHEMSREPATQLDLRQCVQLEEIGSTTCDAEELAVQHGFRLHMALGQETVDVVDFYAERQDAYEVWCRALQHVLHDLGRMVSMHSHMDLTRQLSQRGYVLSTTALAGSSGTLRRK